MSKVSRKQVCRNMLAEGQSDELILWALSDLYIGDGKDLKYSDSRAKAILWSTKKEQPRVAESNSEVSGIDTYSSPVEEKPNEEDDRDTDEV